MPSFACSLISKLTQCIKRSCFHVSDRAVETFSILCDVIFLVRPQGKFEADHSQE